MKKIILLLMLVFSLIFAQNAHCASNETPLAASEVERNNPGFKLIAKDHGKLFLGAGTIKDSLTRVHYSDHDWYHPNIFLQNESHVVLEKQLLFIDEDSIYEAETDQYKYWVANVYVISLRGGYDILVTYRINKKSTTIQRCYGGW